MQIPVVSNPKLAEDVESKGTTREYAVQSLKVQAHLANLPNVSTQRNQSNVKYMQSRVPVIPIVKILMMCLGTLKFIPYSIPKVM